jgi:ribosomal RNA-processing protein 8
MVIDNDDSNANDHDRIEVFANSLRRRCCVGCFMKKEKKSNTSLKDKLRRELERTKQLDTSLTDIQYGKQGVEVSIRQQSPALGIQATIIKKVSYYDKLKRKLQGAHFRYINERLYSIRGDQAFKIFHEDPSLFRVYHDGFRTQVKKWPINPLDIYIEQLRAEPTRVRPLMVADFGCGEARLAMSVGDRHRIHSFDLIAINDYVTACDMAHVPLENCSMDVVIFCLSLMGVNFMEYLREAHRVLKYHGRLKIAEVVSRFPTGFHDFIKKLQHELGFRGLSWDDSSSHFIMMEFEKIAPIIIGDDRQDSQFDVSSPPTLKPCVYKKR